MAVTNPFNHFTIVYTVLRRQRQANRVEIDVVSPAIRPITGNNRCTVSPARGGKIHGRDKKPIEPLLLLREASINI
jgi:hypothetical protein